MALAGIAVEALILARCVFEMARLRTPGALLPPSDVVAAWAPAVLIALVCLLVGGGLYLLKKFELAVALAMLCVAIEIAYRYLALADFG